VKLVLSVILIVTSLSLIALVLLHRGKGGGLSNLFGGGMSSLARRLLRRGEKPRPVHHRRWLVWIASIVSLGLLDKS